MSSAADESIHNLRYQEVRKVTLVGSLLWPLWVGAHSKGQTSRKKMQQRFTDEMMRLVLFGSLVPERHAELAERYRNKNT